MHTCCARACMHTCCAPARRNRMSAQLACIHVAPGLGLRETAQHVCIHVACIIIVYCIAKYTCTFNVAPPYNKGYSFTTMSCTFVQLHPIKFFFSPNLLNFLWEYHNNYFYFCKESLKRPRPQQICSFVS